MKPKNEYYGKKMFFAEIFYCNFDTNYLSYIKWWQCTLVLQVYG